MSSNQQYDDLNPQMKAVEDGKHHLDKHDQTAGLQHFDDHYVLDALITGISTENSDDYEVSIYENGYLSTATRTEISAYAMHAGDWFSIGERVKVKLRTEDNTAWILHEPQPQLGIIVPNGPNGEPARKDRFYHVELSYYSDSDNIPPNTMGTFSGALDKYVLAENLGEPANPDDPEAIDDQGSHNIKTGTPVLLMWNWDQAQGAADGDINENNEAEPNTKRPNRRWFFYHAPTTYAGTFDCKADADPENSDNPPVETQNITRIDFDNDDFDFRVIKNNRDQDYPDTAYINWLGFDIHQAVYGEEDTAYCYRKIIRFDIDSSAAAQIADGSYHDGKSPYEVEWFMNSGDMRRICLSNTDCTNRSNFASVFGTAWVPDPVITVGNYECDNSYTHVRDKIDSIYFLSNDFIAAGPDTGEPNIELIKWRGLEVDAPGTPHCAIKAVLYNNPVDFLTENYTECGIIWDISTAAYTKALACGCAEGVTRATITGLVRVPNQAAISVGGYDCFNDLENERDGIKRLFFFENDFITAGLDSGDPSVELVKWKGMEVDAFGGGVHCNVKALNFDQTASGGEGTSYPVEWSVTTDSLGATACRCSDGAVRAVITGHVTLPTLGASFSVGSVNCGGSPSTASATLLMFSSNDFGVTNDSGVFIVEWLGLGVVAPDISTGVVSGACDFKEIKFDGPTLSDEITEYVQTNFEVAIGDATCIGSGCSGQQAVVTGKTYGTRECFVSDVSCDPDTGEMVITKKSAIMFGVDDCGI